MAEYKELITDLLDRHNEDRYKRLTLDAAAAIEELQAKVLHWVSCEERLPRNGQLVVVIDDDGHANTATLSAMGGWWLSNSNDFFLQMSRVLYWMPLPELPQKGASNG